MNYRDILFAGLIMTLIGCGSSRDEVPLVEDSNGVASISGVAVVGETLSAAISDPDGLESGSESYQWYSDGEAISDATSSSYTLTQNEGSESVTVVARFTDNAGLRETVESEAVEVQAAFNLSMVYVHALVDGATCEISAVDSNGAVVSPSLASATTMQGSVSFPGLVPVDGAALISCTGGTYVDEATGVTLDAPISRAVVDVTSDATFTVSPLTEIATQLAEAAGDLNTAISTHNLSVGVIFGIPNDISTGASAIYATAPTDLATTIAVDDAAGRYAIALALISQLDANDPDSDAATIIAALSADLVDGTFSVTTVADFDTAAIDIMTSPVADNIDTTALAGVQSAIQNVPEPATFENLSATIPNDQVDPITGTVNVIDVNFGENRVIAQTDAQTTYGTFSILESGAWTYTLNTADETVAGLEVGASVNDTILLTSIDGSTANLVIRVSALTQVAEIRNTINGDTGELRLNLDPHQQQGRLSFSFLKTEALADDGNQKDAYVTLYGSSGSSSESLVDLRIQGSATEDDGTVREPRFLVRNTDDAGYPGDTIEAPFTPNEWYEVEIIWDMAEQNQITILINGEALGGGPFSTAAVVDSDFTSLDQWFAEGVETIQWRFGDNGTTIPFGSYFVDNVIVTSDAAGTTTIFEDDFEGYEVGDPFGSGSAYQLSIDAMVTTYDVSSSGGPTPAAFFNLVGTIDSDSTDILTDTVTIIDPDPGEAMLVEQTATTTQFGTFSILPSGVWEYTLDTTNPTIAALERGSNETDTISIMSTDGTTAELVITIKGTIETNTGSDLAVRIADRAADDAGELRYKPSAAIVTGRMTATVIREAGAKAESPNEDAQIAIYGSSTSSANAMAYITLDISGDDFDLRDTTGSSGGGSTAGFVEDQEFNIEIAWDASAATDTIAPLVTITIDGQVAFSGANFDSPSADLSRVKGGVETVQFRVGGTTDITAFGFIVDDFKLYSSDSGSELEIISDDFESYTVGNSLDPNAATAGTAAIPSAVSEPGTPYSNDSFDAFVVETGTVSTGGLGTAGNQFARVADRATDDAGELRYKPSAAIVTGRMTAQVIREAGAKAESPNEDAQIAIYGSSTSSANAMAYITLDISGDDYDLRDSTGSSGGGSTAGFAEDQIIDIEIAWDASAATDTIAPLVTITIDGQVAFSGANFDSPSADLSRVKGGVETVQFRVGGTTDITAFGFIVDDFKLYSSDSGSEVEVINDDFESYTVGNSLDPNAATAGTAAIPSAVSEPGTPYSNDSFDVFVVEE